jgi:hypothetical protein
LAVSVRLQVPVPEQPPPLQPEKLEPESALAVRVIAVPVAKLLEQLTLHRVSPGSIFTLPLPLPLIPAESLNIGMLAMLSSKVAV